MLLVIGFILFLLILGVCIACNPSSKVMYAVQAYRTRKAAIGLPESLPMVDSTVSLETRQYTECHPDCRRRIKYTNTHTAPTQQVKVWYGRTYVHATDIKRREIFRPTACNEGKHEAINGTKSTPTKNTVYRTFIMLIQFPSFFLSFQSFSQISTINNDMDHTVSHNKVFTTDVVPLEPRTPLDRNVSKNNEAAKEKPLEKAKIGYCGKFERRDTRHLDRHIYEVVIRRLFNI